MSELATHIVIPDTQVKPGVPLEHLSWIGDFIVDKYAGRENIKIIHLGDNWDLPSLSSYDKRGSKTMEGKRYKDDVEAGNKGFALINQPIINYNLRQAASKHRQWNPRKVFLKGNHCHRAHRYIEDNPHLDGVLNLELLWNVTELGWEVYDFLEPVCIDGVWYAHYFANPMTGRPWGGAAKTRLNNIGHSFTMGHQQLYDTAVRYTRNAAGEVERQQALIAGACYLHDEDYKSYQGNVHWRGIIVKNEVYNGRYDIMQISLDYLKRRYS